MINLTPSPSPYNIQMINPPKDGQILVRCFDLVDQRRYSNSQNTPRPILFEFKAMGLFMDHYLVQYSSLQKHRTRGVF